jgi:hypothetical protein
MMLKGFPDRCCQTDQGIVMSPKRNAAVACLTLALGCSDSGFRDEAEELEYLSTISQPSVEMIHRKMELEQKKAEADLRTAAEIESVRDAHVRELGARKLAEEKAQEPIGKAEREAEAKEALKEAKEFESRFSPGTPQAAKPYRSLVTEYPESPEADVARARIKDLEEEVEQRRKAEGRGR